MKFLQNRDYVLFFCFQDWLRVSYGYRLNHDVWKEEWKDRRAERREGGRERRRERKKGRRADRIPF